MWNLSIHLYAQNWFHNIINYQTPKGWDHQIASDIILNYFIDYERQLFRPSNNLEIIGDIMANAGTLSNNMGLGIKFRAGLFNDYFSNYEHSTFKDERIRKLGKKKFGRLILKELMPNKLVILPFILVCEFSIVYKLFQNEIFIF